MRYWTRALASCCCASAVALSAAYLPRLPHRHASHNKQPPATRTATPPPPAVAGATWHSGRSRRRTSCTQLWLAQSGKTGADELVTLRELEEYCRPWGVTLTLADTLGVFKVQATKVDPSTGQPELVGYANAFKWGNMLHLETAQIRRKGSLAVDKERPWTELTPSGFQLGAVVGCYAMRVGFDRGCARAELLAIYDEEAQHARLVRYYRIAGFTPIRDVGDDIGDIGDRVTWGGVGTLMGADTRTFLQKWKGTIAAAVAGGGGQSLLLRQKTVEEEGAPVQ